MMFDNARFVTRGVAASIPDALQILLWLEIDAMPGAKDYLQVFVLTPDGDSQIITHRQERPPYEKAQRIPWPNPIAAKVFVIDDETHSTMLLADEY